MKKPLLSIITVCYNAAGEIEKTIRSVLEQRFSDYEYLFIDGASGDETVSIIESFRGQFETRGIPYRVISEPDAGIYYAMNKGISNARGQWILMMNAGDVFVSEQVLAAVFEKAQLTADVIYGDTVFREEYRGKTYYRKVPAKPLEYFDVGMAFCHQSAFVREEVLRRYPFNTEFRLVADYDQFLRMYRDGVAFWHIPLYVAVFDGAGASMRKPLETFREYAEVRKHHGISRKRKPLLNVYLKTKAALRNAAKAMAPGLFYGKARGWQTAFPCCDGGDGEKSR